MKSIKIIRLVPFLLVLATLSHFQSPLASDDSVGTRQIPARASLNRPAVLETFEATVLSVTDGDTLRVVDNKNQVFRVRLEGIDSPELGQAFGNRSKEALASLVSDKSLTIHKTGEDQYGRVIGVVQVGALDVNADLIANGWAWHFKKYNKEERLSRLETEARRAKKGLWSADNPLEPTEFRKRSALNTQEVNPDADVSPSVGPGQPLSTNAHCYWLNTSTNTRHNTSCEYFSNTKRGRFCIPTEGTPCGKCGG